MRGDYQDPEATADAIDTDGWLHTGDIGAMSDDGALRISDRKKDIYISRAGSTCHRPKWKTSSCGTTASQRSR